MCIRDSPPFYVKYKTGNKYLFSDAFVTMGDAQSFVARCEYVEKGIEFSYVGLDEKNAYLAEHPVVEEVKRGPGRPKKETE